MPRLSAWALRAALLYLLAGFTLGALMLADKGAPFWPAVWQVLPVHIEFLLVGWLVQLAMGVAYWILPRLRGGSRGNETLAVIAVISLNLGVLLAAFQGLAPAWLLAGRGCEALAGVLFILHAWRRIRPFA